MSSVPTSADVAKALLPGVRIAARERYGRVRMMFLGPLLPILVQILAHFLLKWLADWLASRHAVPPASFASLAEEWERQRPYEVQMGMTRAAAGETGE